MSDVVKLSAILYAVASEWGVSTLDLKSIRRARAVALPRQAYYHIAAKRTLHSYSEIARHCGNRDHSTIMHGVAAAEQRLATDATFAALYARAMSRLPDWNPPMPKDSRWTTERVELLRQLWATDASDREISRLLGVPHSTLRGKAARLGLGGRPSACTRRGRDLNGGRIAIPKLPPREARQPMTVLADYLTKSTPAAEASPTPAPAAVTARDPAPRAAAVPLPVSLVPSQCSEREGAGRPCQWIHGDVPKAPARPNYCGAPALPGESWCLEHRQRVFIPKAERLVDKGRLERLAAAE